MSIANIYDSIKSQNALLNVTAEQIFLGDNRPIPGKWGSVYLDNAVLPGQSVTQFRSHLSALSKRGEYIVLDGYAFGAVKLAA